MRGALALDRQTLREQEREIRDMREQLRNAVRILGPMSAALPVTTTILRANSRPRVALGDFGSAPQLSSMVGSDAVSAEYSVRDLRVMLARLQQDPVMGMVHVRVRFGDDAVGYAISDEAIFHTPADVLLERVTQELAMQLAPQMKNLRR